MVFEARLAAIAAAVEAGELLFSDHYLRDRLADASRPRVTQIREALLWPEAQVIEDYASHHFSPACLIWSKVESRIIHVLCTYPQDHPIVITAYWPDARPDDWADEEFKVRRR